MNGESVHSTTSSAVQGGIWSKHTLVYLSQVVLIYIIVITSIVNLTLYKNDKENSKIFLMLLSSSVGYLLPNPSLKKYGIPK